jgi:predicted flap endonuclease-1-like 5' DNA nuclease
MTPLPAVEIQPEVDPKLGLIYKTRPEKTDDLTALKGIAQVLEQRLHDFGIYTYAQIAAWDEDRIKEFSARLAFKDRIQREHWVEQARQLAAKQASI